MRISIAGKICFVLLLLFSCVLLGTTSYQAKREQQWVTRLAEARARIAIQEFLSRANQQPAGSATLKQVQQDGLTIRYIPTKDYASATQRPGERDVQVIRVQSRSLLQLTLPVFGIQAEDSRIYYSLQQPGNAHGVGTIELEMEITAAMSRVEEDIFWTALILCLFFGSALLLALYIIRQQIVTPLLALRQAMERATDLRDFTTRLPTQRHDEISQLNDSFNQLMIELKRMPSPMSSKEPSI